MLHKKYGINENGKDYIIGDLHGCYDLLMDKLYEIGFNKENDRLFSVGDLIDRGGGKSLECLKLIKENWFHPVQSNHEDMMLSHVLDGYSSDMWVMNGGYWFLSADKDEVKDLSLHVRGYIPYSITVETKNGFIGICHAQPPSINWEDAETPNEKDIKIMLWARNWIADANQNPVENIYKTFHGHTPIQMPVDIANTRFIDTGAFHTNKLTLVELI